MTPRRVTHGSKAYAVPLLWVFALIGSYWLLAEWPDVSRILASLTAHLRWPV